MLIRQIRSLHRCFSTVKVHFDEHYQYPGNPTNQEFTEMINESRKTYVQDTTIFKPKDQIEFNRTGELVLYEADVYKLKPVYFPYPHSAPLQAVPFFVYMYLANPFEMLWHYNNIFAWATIMSFLPMVEHYYDLRFYINRLSLLRGGKVLKVEHSNVVGNRWKSWIYIDEIHMLSADKQILLPEKGIDEKVVDEKGQLENETHIQVENFIDVGRNAKNTILSLCKDGRVYHPDILSAVLRGFEVDTSNFRINTLHTERWLEPNTNL